MRKKKLFILVLCFICALFGMSTWAFGEVAKLPSKVTTTNVALGKAVEFRSLTKFDDVEPMYNYFPDDQGLNNTSVYGLVNNTFTDGSVPKDGGFHMDKLNSTNVNTTAWAFIDLGTPKLISRVDMWLITWWKFKDVVIQVSNSPTFDAADGSTKVVYSNDLDNSLKLGAPVGDYEFDVGGEIGANCYSDNGHIPVSNKFAFDAVFAQYVRVHNQCVTKDNLSLYAEIEVQEISGVIAPSASIAGGTYEELSGSIALSTPYKNATIYYTLDGSYPTVASIKYTAPIDRNGNLANFVLRAITVLDNGELSYPANFKYILEPKYNLAQGKEATFRSFDDMTQVLDMYNYFPDANSQLPGSVSLYPFENNSLTDGNVGWGLTQTNATMTDKVGWAFIDLGKSYALNNIGISFLGSFAFQNVVIQISDDPLFQSGVKTVFANTCAPLLNSKNEQIYDGTQVGIANRSDIGGLENKFVYSNGGIHKFPFERTVARYVRMTNFSEKKINNGILQEDSNTVFSEIEVNYADCTDGNVSMSHILVEVKSGKLEVPFSLNKEKTIALLPATMEAIDEIGNSHMLSVVGWESAAYDGMTAGDYNFTATLQGLSDILENVFTLKANVMVTVKVKADFTQLDALIITYNEVQQTVNGKTYTTKTWEPFVQARSNAIALQSKLETSQEDINLVLETLKTMKRVLEFRGDKTELSKLITSCLSLDINLYTTTSKINFAEKLELAETQNHDGDASERNILLAYSELNEIYGNLQLIGNTDALKTLLDTIKAKKYDLTNYILSVRAAMEDAIATAESLLDLKASTPNEVKEIDVKSCIAELNRADNAMNEGLLGDKAELSAAVTAAELLDCAAYTTASYAKLLEKITSAKALINAEIFDFTISKVTATIEDIHAATEELVLAVDRSALRATIAKAIEKIQSDYTANSFAILTEKLANANLIVKKPLATKEEVSTSLIELEAAIHSLQLRGDLTLLLAEIEKAQNIILSKFTPSSGASLTAVLRSALEVSTSKDATQSMIDGAKNSLSLACSNLIEIPIKTELQRLIEQYANKKTGNKKFDESYKQAIAVCENPNSTTQDVENAIAALESSYKAVEESRTITIVVAVCCGAVVLAAACFLFFKLRKKSKV